MSEWILGLAFLLGGGVVISYAYSSVLFENPADAMVRQNRATAFVGFERRDLTRLDRRRRREDLEAGMEDRRLNRGRRATDRRHA